MAAQAGTDTDTVVRVPLSRDRILRTAVAVADRGGLDAVTMRGVADELGVEAMSLYHHVANKEAMLDGTVEVVMAEIMAEVDPRAVPDDPADWKYMMRARILGAREVMLRHPWAPAVIESRTSISPSVAVWMDGILGLLRAGGLSWDHCHHAMHALGSRALGFNQELFQPDDAADAADVDLLAEMAEHLPHIVGMLQEVVHDDPDTTLGWCDDQAEFEFGLDLLLDGLERLVATD